MNNFAFHKSIFQGVPVVTFGLGVWQVQRRSWKLNLLQELEQKTSQAPMPLPFSQEELKKIEYQKVKVRGEFFHDKIVYIGPRSLNEKESAGGGLMGNPNTVGFHVITPFLLENSEDNFILVNRGWVPKDKLSFKSRNENLPIGVIDLVGVVRMSEPRQQFTPKNQFSSDRWSNRNIDELAEKLDTLPIFIDADFESSVPNGPIGGQTRVTLRNDHLTYLITWFTLSGLTSLMWFKRYVK